MEQTKSRDKIRDIFTKIKEIRHIKLIVCILITAIVMLVYTSFTSGKKTVNTISEAENIDYKINYNEEEEKLADILSKIDGVGKTKVLITYNSEKAVNGVIVVAEGASNPLAEWQIRHAVQTALNIDYHAIEVYSMK